MPSGGSFLVSIKNGGLSLESQGRVAVGVLMFPDAQDSPSPLIDSLKNVFDSMSRGDFAPLEGIVAPQAALEHTKRFGAFWRDWESTLGRYESTQILFTTPTGSRISTYLQLNFEKGKQVIRAAQREGGPMSFSRGGVSATYAFLAIPVGRNEFSYFDFRSGKSIVIQFATTDDGRVSAMVLRMPKGRSEFPLQDYEPSPDILLRACLRQLSPVALRNACPLSVLPCATGPLRCGITSQATGRSSRGSDPKRSTCPSGSWTLTSYAHGVVYGRVENRRSTFHVLFVEALYIFDA